MLFRGGCAAFLLAGIFLSLAGPAAKAAPAWDPPKPVSENTVFFGEKGPAGQSNGLVEAGQPAPDDKSYPWYWLEKGNGFLLAGHAQKAAVAFENAYAIGGPTRVLSGFKLVEAYETLGRVDEAIAVLEQMRKKYLVSNQEFGQANLLRARLEDQKRKKDWIPPPSPLVGREWLLWTSPERMRYVLDAMEVLRSHGVPLNEPAQKYVFLLDEYFIARPEEPAHDAPEVLARIVYENDSEARVPVDRWRINPKGTLAPPPPDEAKKFSGAEWITMVHEDKMNYVLGAMAVLKNQQVPMQRSAQAYEYALDELFTRQPELLASDSVVALGSILYDTEPEAREILEALRLHRRTDKSGLTG